MRRLTIGGVLIACCMASSALAQSSAPTAASPARRPPVFLSEGWQTLSTPTDEHGAWPASQAGVASPNLELALHGPSGKEIQLVGDQTTGPSVDFNEAEISLADVRWLNLDIDRM